MAEHTRRGEPALPVEFFEVAPENYMRRGGFVPYSLGAIRERYPIFSHGLTLSVGGWGPFDDEYLTSTREFVRGVGATFHSDHLCVGGANGRLVHDLLPVPPIEEAVAHTARRAEEVRERLGLPLALENISYYVTPCKAELGEAELLSAILSEADLGLLLDVNNVYVNATNFGFDPIAFLDALPLERVVQIHVAGHEWRSEHRRIIDTHGAPSIPAVHELLAHVIRTIGSVPVLLERDNHVPPLSELLAEVTTLRRVIDSALAERRAANEGSSGANLSPEGES